MVSFVRAASHMVAIYAREDLRDPPPNYALERPVTGFQECVAGARNNFAPAALGGGQRPAAQRER